MRLLRRLFVLPIRLYRRFITPYTPPTCRFRPSCSAYGEAVILEHGLIKGCLLLTWRILRCQPLCSGGEDPVPPRGAWRPSRAEKDPPAEEQRKSAD